MLSTCALLRAAMHAPWLRFSGLMHRHDASLVGLCQATRLTTLATSRLLSTLLDCPLRRHQEESLAHQAHRLFGDPALRTPASPVVDFDKNCHPGADLTDTMVEAPGAGLAAPQLGVGLRVFTWNVDGELGHLVNLRRTLSEEIQDGPEGCLSIPGLTIDCKRALSVVAHGFDMYGEPVIVEGSEMLARAIQHETDHLDGIIFVDRLDREARKEAMKYIREAEWFGHPRPR